MYEPVKSPCKVRPEVAGPIKAMIEAEPSFGFRTVACLPGMNKNTVQRIFQRMGWRVRKRAVGASPPSAGIAFDGWAGQRVMGSQPVQGVGWPGRLAEPDAGDRLLYPRVAGLAVLAQRQGDHGGVSIGAGADRPVR